MNKVISFLTLLIFASFISCDKDYNTIGLDAIGDEHFNFQKEIIELKASNYGLGVTQSNNLPVNALGIFSNPLFGNTKSHIVTQIELIAANPNVGYEPYIDPVLDSVYIYIPYYSTYNSTSNTYSLDSVYGNKTAKFDLKIYKNNYTLRDFDPADNFQSTQNYFSDIKSTIDAQKGPILNTSSNDAQNSQFFFDSQEIKLYKRKENGDFVNSSGQVTTTPSEYVVKEKKIPGMWIDLDKELIENYIIEAGLNGKLFNNNVFKEHFRGLFFEVNENSPGQGAMAKLDFTKAEILIQFHASTTQGGTPTKRNLKLQTGYSTTNASKKSNVVNIFEYQNTNTAFSNAISNQNLDLGTDKIYLKGGAGGSVAYIDIKQSDIEELKIKNYLINEASIVFFIDESTFNSYYSGYTDEEIEKFKALRIYLYDAINNKPIADYTNDPTTSTNSKNNKRLYGGMLERSESNKGIKYKIRITEHIKEILKGDSENVRLGLVVTEDIKLTSNANLKTPFSVGTTEVKYTPVSSVLNPLGTVLYGNLAPEDKKLKLEIYYTETN